MTLYMRIHLFCSYLLQIIHKTKASYKISYRRGGLVMGDLSWHIWKTSMKFKFFKYFGLGQKANRSVKDKP